MKILHVISGIDPRNGGPTTALTAMAQAQAARGLNVSVVATWQCEEAFQTARRLEAEGVEAVMIGPASGKLSRHPKIGSILRERIKSADVVHIHAVWEEIQTQAGRLARDAGKPYIITPHGMLDRWNMRKNRWLKGLYFALRQRNNFDRAAAVHFTTEIERDSVQRFGLKSPSFVEPLGIDFREFAPPPEPGRFRAAFPATGNKLLVVFLGRLHPGKGAEVLIPAFAKAEIPNAMLVVAGPDSSGFRGELERRAAELGVRDRVVFTGMLEGRRRLEPLVDGDVFALPSSHENFGLAVVEAMAAGTPVIVSDQVNLHREICAAGAGAVAPASVDDFAAELRRWLMDKSLRDAAGAKAAQFAREHFDRDVIAGHWIEHYRRVQRGGKGI